MEEKEQILYVRSGTRGPFIRGKDSAPLKQFVELQVGDSDDYLSSTVVTDRRVLVHPLGKDRRGLAEQISTLATGGAPIGVPVTKLIGGLLGAKQEKAKKEDVTLELLQHWADAKSCFFMMHSEGCISVVEFREEGEWLSRLSFQGNFHFGDAVHEHCIDLHFLGRVSKSNKMGDLRRIMELYDYNTSDVKKEGFFGFKN